MGLGSFPDVSLLEARQYALHNKQLLGKKIDPIDEKNRAHLHHDIYLLVKQIIALH